jgi:hypothetical protein
MKINYLNPLNSYEEIIKITQVIYNHQQFNYRFGICVNCHGDVNNYGILYDEGSAVDKLCGAGIDLKFIKIFKLLP